MMFITKETPTFNHRMLKLDYVKTRLCFPLSPSRRHTNTMASKLGCVFFCHRVATGPSLWVQTRACHMPRYHRRFKLGRVICRTITVGSN